MAGGGRIRILTVLDRYTRQCPGIEAGSSIGSRRVTRALERMIARRGTPKRLRCGNGQEFTSRRFLDWCGRPAHRGRPHSAGAADRARRSGELPRPAEGRVPECELVCEPGRGEEEDRGLEKGVQQREAARAVRDSARRRSLRGSAQSHRLDGRTGRRKPGFPNCQWERKEGRVSRIGRFVFSL